MLEQLLAAFGHVRIYRADNLFQITALFFVRASELGSVFPHDWLVSLSV